MQRDHVFPACPCKAIIYSEKGEALLSSRPHSHQGYVHQGKVVIHSEGKLHGPMVTRTYSGRSAVGRAVECKIIGPSVAFKQY